MRQIAVRQRQAVLEEAEAPVLSASHPARVLVKVRYSSISPGTELNLIHHMDVPDGFQLGYSASGQVLEVGPQVTGLAPGDWVACYGGPYVYHAEQLSVPRQLCVKLSDESWLREAALVGLGSVAIHSVPGSGGSSANRSGWSAWDCSASLSRSSAIRRITAYSRPI